MENLFAHMASKIIREQQTIMGPVALEVASKVHGLHVNKTTLETTIEEGKETAIVNELVQGYEAIFGRASVEVCRDAVKDTLSKLDAEQIPPTLR